ncbi:MAG TPA: class I SAM-dependent methyltransferase [Methanothermococcus okinawensis]|uniref:Class I SAM-dependent methyltransferase n=1 Tax=Methanothermococcus okinawensis TaxID=155863 RepID=A0A833DS11_9EURY|nr:class I SAM-dependent methyltransferase [Methanothermococcus okinawensis]
MADDKVKDKKNTKYNEIKEFYNNWNVESYPEYFKVLMDLEEKLIIDIIKNLKEYDTIKRGNGIILDCGCGFGSFYTLTKDLNTIYLDFSINLLKKFKNNYNLKSNKICGDILNLPFKDNSFDLIFCINVLEHVIDYKGALREMKRVLKKEGVLIVIVVNGESFIKESIFNEFRIYHRALSLNDINVEGFEIIEYNSFYFIPPILKILPTSLLRYFINNYYLRIEDYLRNLFKNKGQFLYVILKKIN